MNGHRAKVIRRTVYGTTFSPRHRTYHTEGSSILADTVRRAYQEAKRRWYHRRGR